MTKRRRRRRKCARIKEKNGMRGFSKQRQQGHKLQKDRNKEED